MRTLVTFVAGFAAGWLALGLGVRWVNRREPLRQLPLVSGTISSPEGEWEFTGATLVKSPWNR